ncbi:MAG: DUF3187 family protein [Acidobacteriota bacterium]
MARLPFFAVVLFSLVVLPLPAASQEPSPYLIDTGPLRIRDQFPLSMGYLAFDPVSAVVLDRGEWQIDVVTTLTNTWAQSDVVEGFLEDRDGRLPLTRADLTRLDGLDPNQGLVFVDAELVRSALAVRRGFGDGVQLELVLPVLNYSGGFLDSTIEGFHDSFSFSQAGRLGVERDDFRAFVSHPGGTYELDGDPGARFGDLVVGAKFRLFEPNGERRYHLALETVLELPTGSASQLGSNGAVDGGAQLLFTRYFEHACLHLSAGVLYLGAWDELSIGEQVMPSAMVAWEQGLGPKTSALAQLTVGFSPLDDLEIDELSGTTLQLTVGVKRVVFADKVLFLGITENLLRFDSTSDVGAHFGITTTF